MRQVLAFLVLVGCSNSGSLPPTGDAAAPRSDGGAGCSSDGDCSGATPRCDRNSGKCVPCLPTADNCPTGERCIATNGSYACSAMCQSKADCSQAGSDCCNGTCIDVGADSANCGSCGHACASGAHATATCAAGACHILCDSGFGDCNQNAGDGCEVDLTSDKANCGGCGTMCAAGPNAMATCQAARCALVCSGGYADCNNNAGDGCEANTATDVNNCGACGTSCGALANAQTTCSSGMCAIVSCNSGYADCDNKLLDGCEVNLGSDIANCGGCAHTCPAYPNAMASCTSGTCGLGTCNAGFANCDNLTSNGCEVNIAGDLASCGACGRVCTTPNATPACVSGMCSIMACNGGYSDCNGDPTDGCEVQTATDVRNCGMCGTVCPTPANATVSCTNATCGAACKTGFGDCDKTLSDGCEATLATDANNCGSCGTVCPTYPNATPGCSGGQCGIGACVGLFGNCDGVATNGCEKPLAGDVNNCGVCGKVCSFANGSGTCTNGQCVLSSCNSGFADCDGNAANGCEVNLATDKNNCSKCGNVCPMACSNSTCVACNTSVLVLGENQPADQQLVNALDAAGMNATLVASGSETYGGQPAATSYGAVIILDGTTYATDMPLTGQSSIVNAENGTTGVIFTEWAAYQLTQGRFQTLAPLLLIARTNGNTSQLTFSSTANHAIWSGVPSSFTTTLTLGSNTGTTLTNGGTSIANMTIPSCAGCPNVGVAVRDNGRGRVVQFAHAASYNANSGTGTDWMNETNLSTLMVNAAKWAARCTN